MFSRDVVLDCVSTNYHFRLSVLTLLIQGHLVGCDHRMLLGFLKNDAYHLVKCILGDKSSPSTHAIYVNIK